MPRTVADLEKELAETKARLAEAEAKKARKLTLKVSAKGAVSLYGVRVPWPVTFYADEWEVIFGQAEAVRAFVKANHGKLSHGKGDVKTPTKAA